ncbi:MAG: hypothetical protein AAGM22_03315 [Acidobacteriota bacterium]
MPRENKGRLVPVVVLSLILAAAVPALAVDGDNKFSIHGFLTQAYADQSFAEGALFDFAGGPSFSESALGIPESGTFDYRTLALQFRYEISPRDIVVVQLSNEANGDAAVDEFRDEIELDYAFYERRLGEQTSLKVGRVQIPYGIYNEIRDVGTVLPFYRAPFSIYLEGSFTSETVDGLALSHTFAAESDWPVDLDLYLGEYETFESALGDPTDILPLKGEETFGLQAWLNTPLSGLRFGASFQSKTLTGGQEGVFREVGEEQEVEEFMGSIEGVFDRWSVRAEYRAFDPEVPSFISDNKITFDLVAWYGQLGFFATDQLHFYVQYEKQESEWTSVDFVRPADFDTREDLGFAVNYLFTPNLVLKAEYHTVDVESAVLFPAFTPQGLRLDNNILGSEDGNYTIISFSASF